MNKLKLIVYLLFISFFLSCKKMYTSPNTVEQFEITSDYTQFSYKISLLLPADYQTSKTYHTIYLLDGGAYFKEASEVLDKTIQKDLILVSLDYKNENKRATDFTFPEDNSSDDAGTGGGDKFLQFFNEELIPYIEITLGLLSREKTLYGHSFGGYFCLYTMLQNDYLIPFDNFIAASVPTDFAENYLIKKEQEIYENKDDLNYKLHLSYGTLEANALFVSFMNRFEQHSYPSLIHQSELYEHLGHQNTPIKAFENGLKFIVQ